MQLIFATHNDHKVFEIQQLLPSFVSVQSLDMLGFQEEISETALTLHENAYQKAQFIYERFQRPVFSDDSGLEVDELGFRPGVYSARYAGEEKNDDQNMQKVLDELKNTENRTAQFRTVICLIMSGQIHYFEGIIRGHICRELRGKNGFGYDPIFQPEGKLLTFAEMESHEKNKYSHRAQAVVKMSDFLSGLKQ